MSEPIASGARAGSSPAVAVGAIGQLEVFYWGADGDLWNMSWDRAVSSGAQVLGGILHSDSAATAGARGHVDVLALLDDGGLWQRWHQPEQSLQGLKHMER